MVTARVVTLLLLHLLETMLRKWPLLLALLLFEALSK
jgi:hypothetical protein